jgi:integrase
MRVKREFQIYERKHRSGNPGWQVSLGMVNGKRKFQPFTTLEAAQTFKAQCEEKQALSNPAALSDLDALGRAAIRHALEKLKPYDATITEAVDFFIKFAKPTKGKVTIQEAIDLFVAAKTKEKLSTTYIEKSERCFFRPFRDKFKNCIVSEISPAQAEKYIDGHAAWNEVTRNTHVRHLRTFYGFLIGTGHATINPFLSVKFAKVTVGKLRAKVLSVDDTEKLLQYAFDSGDKAACASLSLILFCGVRVEEVDRLTWSNIDLTSEAPFVDIDHAKNGRRRVNELPENAIHWLNACQSKGKVTPDNYAKTMQRLRKKAKIDYAQNAARHSFASYHVALHQDGTKTAFMLGHPDPQLLYSHYRKLVRREDAARYWEIVPKTVKADREAEKKRTDENAREAAESQSNCGRAIQDENGVWFPVMDEDAI